MDIHYIDLTDEVFENYTSCEGIVTLYFGNIGIQMDFLQFKRLKDIILLNEQLSEECRQYEFKEQKPSKETLLKELIKTMDKENSVRKKYNEENVKLSAQMNQNDVKEKLLPLAHELNDIMSYKEKLEAQLKYGGL